MTGVGEFLAKAVDWVYEWWPFRLVREWEQGIRLYAGEVTGTLTHRNGLPGARGLHFFCPKLGEIITQECNWEIIESRMQTVVTKDGRAITVGFAVQYRIRDLKLYYTSIHDHAETTAGAVRAAAGSVVPTFRWEELSGALAAAMLNATKTKMYGWGLEVKDVTPTTLVDAQTLRLITDDTSRVIPNGDGV